MTGLVIAVRVAALIAAPLALVGCAGVAAYGTGYVLASAVAPEEEGRPLILVIYRHGPNWVAGRPMAEQGLKDHFDYMKGLYATGAMKLAGPFSDESGGAVLLTVTGEDEAKAIVAADPAIMSGKFVAELHAWRLVDWQRASKK